MAAKDNFRIVTNGYEYKVEERCRTCWRKREYWDDPPQDNYMNIPRHTTLEAAQQEMERRIVQAARYMDEWKPV